MNDEKGDRIKLYLIQCIYWGLLDLLDTIQCADATDCQQCVKRYGDTVTLEL